MQMRPSGPGQVPPNQIRGTQPGLMRPQVPQSQISQMQVRPNSTPQSQGSQVSQNQPGQVQMSQAQALNSQPGQMRMPIPSQQTNQSQPGLQQQQHQAGQP